MDRYDVSEPERFAKVVSAAEAGISAEITRAGTDVARIVPERAGKLTGGKEFVRRLTDLHRKLPPELMGGDAAVELRAMRDEEW